MNKTVHEYRTRLTEQIADEFIGWLIPKRRARLYEASIKIVDDAMPEGTRHLTVDMIDRCRTKLKAVAVFLRDAPPTPPREVARRVEEGKAALQEQQSRLAAVKRQLQRGGDPMVLGLARMRQELHSTVREVAEKRAKEGGAASSQHAGGRFAESIRDAEMHSLRVEQQAGEEWVKAEQEDAWAQREFNLGHERRDREEREAHSKGREVVSVFSSHFFSLPQPLTHPHTLIISTPTHPPTQHPVPYCHAQVE